MQRIQTLCDRCMSRDNKEVDADAGTVMISVMKKAVEIDLCYGCYNELNELLEPYWESGRRPGKIAYAPTPGTPRRPRNPSDEDDGDGQKSRAGEEPNGPDGKWLCRAPGVECERKDPARAFDSLLAVSIHESRMHGYKASGPRRRSTSAANGKAKPARRPREMADAAT